MINCFITDFVTRVYNISRLYLPYSCSYMLNFVVLPDFVFPFTTNFVKSLRDFFVSSRLRELKMVLSLLRLYL